MYTRFKLTAKMFTGKRIQVVCAALISSYTYAAMKYSYFSPSEAIEWCKTRKYPNKARCSGNRETNNISNPNPLETDTVDLQKPPKNELRIIILGAIGSGKSSVGNVLMKNQLGKPFDTSLSAKPNTTKSTLKTMNFLQYKIDIIDTPGTKASGLTDQAMEIEIQKAIALSSPGPHAFVLCISANDIKDNLFDVIKPYENYFGERFYDHVILAFTRNDQNKSNYKNTPAYLHDCKCKIKHEIAQNSSLAKIKNITNNQVCISFPNSTNNDNNTELRKVIKIIEEIKEGSKESKNVEFASCYFSEYAENILYENICKLKKETNGSNISREIVKTSEPYLEHFSRQFCYFCQQFTR